MELLHQHMNTNDLKNWIILNQTPSIRPKRFLKILNSQLTLKSIIQSPRLTQFHFKLPSKAIEYLENHDDCYYDQPVDWLSRSSNHHIVTDDSQIYPECLRNIPQPPMILYGIGNIDLLDTRQISIVGTRNFSPYGKSNAQYFSKALSNLGYTITSELASGINVIYPHQNMRVARSFIEDFGSRQNRITTLADGFAPDAHLRTDLPKNKPTVSFLKASTAYMALRAGKYLPASKGRSATHNLSMEPKGSPSEDYSTSASPLLSRSAILQLSTQTPSIVTPSTPQPSIKNSESSHPLLQHIHYQTSSINSIIEKSGLDVADISVELLTLELAGHIESVPGGYKRL